MKHLERFKGEYFTDYQFGNPAEAAENLTTLLEKFQREVEAELEKAGTFISPSLRQAVKKQIEELI